MNQTDISIILIETNQITNMSAMFYECKTLKSLPDIKYWNTKNVTDMSSMFNGCISLNSLPDISNWDTRNVTDMSGMFYDCYSLVSLPDISKWDTKNVKDMSYMFSCCKSLYNLPDISKWNTQNVNDISYMFNGCISLKSLPDISEWNTENISNINYLFKDCSNISFLPNIFKWDLENITNKLKVFENCYPPQYFTKNKMKLIYLAYFFNEKIKIFDNNFVKKNKNKCYLIIDDSPKELCTEIVLNEEQRKKGSVKITLLETNQVTDMSNMFKGCQLLQTIEGNFKMSSNPDWDTKNIVNMSGMFMDAIH